MTLGIVYIARNDTHEADVYKIGMTTRTDIGERMGESTGMGYELANIVIFVIVQPALIILFYVLWRRERKINKLK